MWRIAFCSPIVNDNNENAFEKWNYNHEDDGDYKDMHKCEEMLSVYR